MSVKIFLLNIKQRLNEPVDEFLKFFTPDGIARIMRRKFNADRNRTVFAELLARFLISRMTGKHFNETKIFRDDSGRPFCGEPGIFFSLSHSSSWIACSIGDVPNGVDVETLNRKIDINIAKRFFLPKEYEFLKSLDDENERAENFLRLWTLKEACLKCLNLKDWCGVDCEKLLNAGDFIRGQNFFHGDSVIGLVTLRSCKYCV